ncbi:MAG: carboxypeptidase M32 [Clostridia bacterium]|nr:carboxypeptidase M32 [Clostridia bacterium]
MTENEKKLKKLFSILNEVDAYERCLGKMQFDLECCAPEEGMEQAGEDMATIGKRVHALTHTKTYEKLVCELYENSEGLSEAQKKGIEHLYEDWKKEKNISAKLSYEMDCAFNKAYADWLKAKNTNDFSLYRDSFASAIKYNRMLVEVRDEQKKTVYDTLLDDYEKGGGIEQLNEFFGALKKRIVPLMKKIAKEGKPIRSDFMSRPVPIPQQEAFSRYLLELEGLRKTALVLMTTEHPFTDHYGPTDVRVTTHYYENNFISNIFSTLHEGGHALFMQNEPKELYDNHAADNMTSAMHECISRFYENIVGRSEEFIHFVMPKLKELSGGTFDDITERELYEAVNIAKPGLIRMEADELSYCIHIMVRYELEKAFVNGEITVDEIPALWNAKYKEYLGLDVPDDSRGCLQDVHWTGMFGYFPSYALGNAYGAQILNTMKKDFDVFGAIKEGRLNEIADWLTEKVFSIASLKTPDEWIKAITGESLNVDYYLNYLEEKFTKLYGLRGNK